MKKIYLFLLPIMAFFIFHYNSNAQNIEVSGDVTEDTTWFADTVKVTGDINIPDSVTLTIEPGTKVLFYGHFAIFCQGIIKASGTENDTIIFSVPDTTGFSSTNTDSGGWWGISFYNPKTQKQKDTSILNLCKFEYSKNGSRIIDGTSVSANNYSKLKISDCIFQNSYNEAGGIIYCTESDIIIENCLVINNNTYYGALYIRSSDALIKGNTFIYNKINSFNCPSCIYNIGGESVILNNAFYNNYEKPVYLDNSYNVLMGNIFSNNEGYVFDLQRSSPLIKNNTIVNNDKGIYCYMDSDPTISNTIIWGNGSQIRLDDHESNPRIISCDIQNGMAGISGLGTPEQFVNNIDQDPYFALSSDGAGSDYPGMEADWSLTDSSACMNKGVFDTTLMGIYSTDIMGNTRILYGQIDIGAVEFKKDTMTVSGIIDENKLWIADTIKVTNDVTINDNIILEIAPGVVVLFYGYTGIDVYGTLVARGMPDYPILFTTNDTSGLSNQSGNDGGWAGIRFKRYIGIYDNDTSILNYCIFQYGKSVIDRERGGAIHIDKFPLIKILDCTFRENYAHTGGAMYMNETSYILIRNCIFEFNRAIVYGGGIYAGSSKPTILNNIFAFNQASWGGGISLGTSMSKVINNLICNNLAFDSGGGIYTQPAGKDEIIMNNIIVNNKSNSTGGGITIGNADCRLLNNTIVNNRGGGIEINGASPELMNNIIWSNYTNQVYILGTTCYPVMKNCLIEGDTTGFYVVPSSITKVPGIYSYIIDKEPHFKIPSSGDGTDYDGREADYSLTDISPCINGGKSVSPYSELYPYDQKNNSRIYNDTIDIGALENHGNIPQILSQPGNQFKCEGEKAEFRIVLKDTAYYQWEKDGKALDGDTGRVLVFDSVTIKNQGNYQCVVSNAYGSVTSTPALLQVTEKPVFLSEPGNTWAEEGKLTTLTTYSKGTNPTFKWQKDAVDIPGGITPELKILNTGYDDEGEYVCIASNGCGTDTTAPSKLFLAPQICMVTVSTISGNNLVVWEKKSKALLQAYNIYRESTAAGIYDLMDTVPYNNLSIYEDTTADPTKRAYIYKLTGIDNSGYETDLDLCKPHKTIHLLVSTNPELKSTQLAWDKYYGFDYQTYNIYRSSTGTNFTVIDAMPSTLNSWTDPEAVTGELYYRVAVEKPSPCLPAGSGKKAESGPYSHSMSNMDDNRLQAGENPPDTIMLTNSVIDENNGYGMLIGRLNTIDADTLDAHTYSLVSGEGDNDNTSFTILGDMLLAAEIFDYESKSIYSIRVRCTDKNNLTNEETFTILINDVVETGLADNHYSNKIHIYPNPFNKSTILMFNNPEGYSYSLYIMDLSGKVCRIVNNINTSRYELKKESLKEGFYFIELRGPKVLRGKIIVE